MSVRIIEKSWKM